MKPMVAQIQARSSSEFSSDARVHSLGMVPNAEQNLKSSSFEHSCDFTHLFLPPHIYLN